MFKIIGNKRLLMLLFVLIVFIALMGLTLRGRAQLSWPEKFFKDTVSFTEGLFYRPASAVAGFFGNIGDLHAIYVENQALKSKLNDYVRDTARLNALEAENARLEKDLNFTERQRKFNQYTWVIAHVVSQNPDPLSRTINIDLGAKNGIKIDMAVVSPEGLIGRVVSVAEFYSTVQLLTDTEHNLDNSKAIAATIQGKTSSFGIIESYDSSTGDLIMDKIPETDPIAVGDTVMTSGLGTVFPAGIKIGKVVSRKSGEFGITLTAMVKPSATFNRLREVFVVKMPDLPEVK